MSSIDNPTTTSTNTNSSTNRRATAHPLINSTSQVSKFSANTSSDESSSSSLHVNPSTDTQRRQDTTPMSPSTPAPLSTPSLTSLLANRRNRVCGGIFRPVTDPQSEKNGVGVEYAWPYAPSSSNPWSHSQVVTQPVDDVRDSGEDRNEDREGREEEHVANEAFFRRGSSYGDDRKPATLDKPSEGTSVPGGRRKFSFEKDLEARGDSGDGGSMATNLATRDGVSERSASVYSQVSSDDTNKYDGQKIGHEEGELKKEGETMEERGEQTNDTKNFREGDVRDAESRWSTQAIINGKTAVKKEVKSLRSRYARFGNLRGVRSRVATRTASLGDSLAKTTSSLNIKKARSVKTGEDGQERLKARRVSTGSAGGMESGMLGGNAAHGPGGSVAEGGSAESDRGSRQSSGGSKRGSRRRQRRVY